MNLPICRTSIVLSRQKSISRKTYFPIWKVTLSIRSIEIKCKRSISLKHVRQTLVSLYLGESEAHHEPRPSANFERIRAPPSYWRRAERRLNGISVGVRQLYLTRRVLCVVCKSVPTSCPRLKQFLHVATGESQEQLSKWGAEWEW